MYNIIFATLVNIVSMPFTIFCRIGRIYTENVILNKSDNTWPNARIHFCIMNLIQKRHSPSTYSIFVFLSTFAGKMTFKIEAI